MIERGAIFWTDLGASVGSRPAKRRPVLVVQSDAFNRSRIATVLVVVISSNLDLADFPGNVRLSTGDTGLSRDSVLNVTGVVTLDKADLVDYVSTLPPYVMAHVDRGLRTVLDLR